ncbi:HAD-IA family hydrolase [Variovorax guangxiensis]|uniref:HAD-IA family hydrolase n=1 Tax=Variovorax guangxiensis TaxID=1775474 RepID=UPI0028579539|nr:HAD-IA family hydrolase [Variovorax guangxiensis]MDR6855115.1 phosphoglycolate phosphatase [Variovorax guangxiensis]
MKDLSEIDAIAFDLDGTLVDSAPDIRHALNAALEEAGLPHFDLDTVRAWIGDGPDALIACALCGHGLDADEAARARLRKAFDAATLAAPLQSGSVFHGIAELVAGLARRLPLVVVTNKPTPLARAVLDAAGLLPFLSAVHGADAAAQRKPAPFLLRAAAHRLGVAPERLLMVGDGPADVLAARAAGCPAALVAWGYGECAAAAAAAPAWRLATPQQLLLTALASRAPRSEAMTND